MADDAAPQKTSDPGTGRSTPVDPGGPLPTASLTIGTLTRVEPAWVRQFDRAAHEWRRLFAEAFGTFLLVLVAAGTGVVDARFPGTVSGAEAVVAPALMVMAVILSMGAVSGAHLNPIVSLAFSLRGEFPWRRIPAYVVAQMLGATLAMLSLWALFGRAGAFGSTHPGAGMGDWRAMLVEAVLSAGLVTTILGTASGAQNVGALSAIAVGGYIALAGMWAGPVSGASMNPVRSLAPDLVSGHYGDVFAYLTGPFLGAALAVLGALVLRGPGRDLAAARAAQGTLDQVVLASSRAVPHHDQGTPEP